MIAARQPAPPRQAPDYLPQIQVLRFCTAASIVMAHAQTELLENGIGGRFANLWMVPAGGVDVFFVISGFIISHITQTSFGRSGEAGVFLIRRLIRIAPIYWLATGLMIVVALVFDRHVTHHAFSAAQVVGSFLFIPVEGRDGSFLPILRLGWTLNFEMMFYALFCVALLCRRGVGLALVAGVLLLLAFVVPHFDTGSTPLTFWANPIVLEFLFGIVLGEIYARGVRVSRRVGWFLVACGTLLIVALPMSGVHVREFPLLRAFVIGVPAFLVCAGSILRGPSGDRLRSMPGRLLILGGNASYSIYLFHPFLLGAVQLAAPKLQIERASVAFVAMTALAIAVPVAIHRFVERPAVQELARWTGARDPRAPGRSWVGRRLS